MPTVKVQKTAASSPPESFEIIKNMLETDAELRKLDSAYACEFDPQTLTGTASGSQFTASMKVLPSGQGSEVEIQVDLPFKLALIKGVVQKKLQAKLDQLLG